MQNPQPHRGSAAQPASSIDWTQITNTYPWYPLGWAERWRQHPEDPFAREMGLMHFQYPLRMQALGLSDPSEAAIEITALTATHAEDEQATSDLTLNESPQTIDQELVDPVDFTEESVLETDEILSDSEDVASVTQSETDLPEDVDHYGDLQDESLPELSESTSNQDIEEDSLTEIEDPLHQEVMTEPGQEPLAEPSRQEMEGPESAETDNLPQEADNHEVNAIESGIRKTADADEKVVPHHAAEAAESDLIFQPYHTVDYFASQGVRVDNQLPPVTRFDRQLRSFTEWLRTMKPIESAAEPDADEKRIPQMAEASNKQQEVITEPMAEVLLKQGKKAQAKAIFEKLSLLHPEKSSYFAARIKELNN